MKINIHISKKPNQGKRIRGCTFGTPLFNNLLKAQYSLLENLKFEIGCFCVILN